ICVQDAFTEPNEKPSKALIDQSTCCSPIRNCDMATSTDLDVVNITVDCSTSMSDIAVKTVERSMVTEKELAKSYFDGSTSMIAIQTSDACLSPHIPLQGLQQTSQSPPQQTSQSPPQQTSPSLSQQTSP